MKQFTNKNLLDLLDKGYTQIQLLDEQEISEIIQECEEIHDKYNNDEFEKKGATYPSKGHEKKKSVIVMLSQEDNKTLPSISDIGPVMKKYLKFNSDILFKTTGIQVPLYTRYMINYRKYLGETDPVFDHFDGEYVDGFIDEPSYHFFNEALLPRFVSLLTLKGGGQLEGPTLTNVITGHEINCSCVPGEVFIFDNIKFKHRVPKLIKPRTLLGLRNFDFLPIHYVLEPIDGYTSLGDKINHGYIRPVGCKEAEELILQKLHNKKYQ